MKFVLQRPGTSFRMASATRSAWVSVRLAPIDGLVQRAPCRLLVGGAPRTVEVRCHLVAAERTVDEAAAPPQAPTSCVGWGQATVPEARRPDNAPRNQDGNVGVAKHRQFRPAVPYAPVVSNPGRTHVPANCCAGAFNPSREELVSLCDGRRAGRRLAEPASFHIVSLSREQLMGGCWVPQGAAVGRSCRHQRVRGSKRSSGSGPSSAGCSTRNGLKSDVHGAAVPVAQ